MVIKQRTTRFDDFLLKVALPMLHELGLGRIVTRSSIWHRAEPSKPAIAKITSSVDRPVQVMPNVPSYYGLNGRKAA